MIETFRSHRWSLTLALWAAAICSVYAACSGADRVTTAWRGIVAFAAVWVYQRLLAEFWTVLDAEPAREAARNR